jgi:hypothetical protein
MLTDIELFIVTCFLAGIGLISLLGAIYSSSQIWRHRKNLHITDQGFPKDLRLTKEGAVRLRYLSILILILSCVTGGIISTVNWISPTEYNYDTVLLRALAPDLTVFSLLLLFGGLIIYIFSGVLKEG